MRSSTPPTPTGTASWRSISLLFFRPARFSAGHMIQAGSGAIVNIGSVTSHLPLSKVFAYSASKAGVLNLTRNIAQEFAPLGVRVNAICPGFFPADQNRKLLDAWSGPITPSSRGTPMRPFRRAGRTDLAPCCSSFPARPGRFITGCQSTSTLTAALPRPGFEVGWRRAQRRPTNFYCDEPKTATTRAGLERAASGGRDGSRTAFQAFHAPSRGLANRGRISAARLLCHRFSRSAYLAVRAYLGVCEVVDVTRAIAASLSLAVGQRGLDRLASMNLTRWAKNGWIWLGMFGGVVLSIEYWLLSYWRSDATTVWQLWAMYRRPFPFCYCMGRALVHCTFDRLWAFLAPIGHSDRSLGNYFDRRAVRGLSLFPRGVAVGFNPLGRGGLRIGRHLACAKSRGATISLHTRGNF